MEILVIDREQLSTQLITSRLEAKGHKVTTETNKQNAFDLIRLNKYDCILVDPAPLSEARPVVIGIWKNLRHDVKPYVLLLSKTATEAEAIAAGTNDVLPKPLSTQELETKVGNALRLMDLTRLLHGGGDIPSQGGVVGKDAFNQLFLSAIDRAFRYGERSLVVYMEVVNMAEIEETAGKAAKDEMYEKLIEKLTFMRRQSDVIGCVGRQDFAILLQRPQYESEPLDALSRFSEVLDKFCQSLDNPAVVPHIRLQLIELPQGALHGEKTVPSLQSEEAAGEGEEVVHGDG